MTSRRCLLTLAVLLFCGRAGAQTMLLPPPPDELADLRARLAAVEARTYTDAPAYGVTEQTPDYPTVNVHGFFQADAGWFVQDDANKRAVGDAPDGADFRRARLSADGRVWDDVSYFMEFDFAFPGRPSFMDVWVQYEDVGAGEGDLRIGYFRTPIGMNGLTSVKTLAFLERPLPFAFLPFRQTGLQYAGQSADGRSTYAVSGFRFPTDFFAGVSGDDGGYGVAGRLTRLLVDEGEDRLVHVGAGFAHADPANDLIRYRAAPEFFISETGGAVGVPLGTREDLPPFVDTSILPTDNTTIGNLEFATSAGSLWTQSELYMVNVDLRGGGNPRLYGGYAQVGYILTGETRQYIRAAGVFGDVTPDSPIGEGCGAWEVAARYSYLDLSDEAVRGGRLDDVTLGLNWYTTPNTKFQFNYIRAFLSGGPGSETAGVDDSDAHVFAVRAQLVF